MATYGRTGSMTGIPGVLLYGELMSTGGPTTLLQVTSARRVLTIMMSTGLPRPTSLYGTLTLVSPVRLAIPQTCQISPVEHQYELHILSGRIQTLTWPGTSRGRRLS